MSNTDYDFNIDQRLSYLESLAHQQATEIAELREMYDVLKPASKLPFLETLTPGDLSRIVKLRFDLFYNSGAKQGTPKWDLKTFVWLDSSKGNNGTIQPFHFWLQRVEYMDIMAYDDSVLAQLARQVESGTMVGCLTHRGSKSAKAKGTVRHKDHVAVVAGNELLLRIGTWCVHSDGYESTGDGRKPGTPIGRWWWNKVES